MRSANPFIYTAIGDSLSVGTGSLLASGFEKRYAGLTEQALQRPVEVNIFAKNGATSGEILQRLRTDKVKSAIYYSSIISITAGGNDLIHAARQYSKTKQPDLFKQAVNNFAQNLSSMLQEIYVLKSSFTSPFIIRLVGLYNPFPRIQGSDYYVLSFNSRLQQFANSNTAVANIFYPFKQYGKKVLSLDGLHPNGKGYQVIAEILYQLGYFPLSY